MGIFLLVIYFLLPLMHVLAVLTVVIVGAAIYILVLFKLDRKIHDEIRDSGSQSRCPVARWL